MLHLVVVTLRLWPAKGGAPDGLADRLADALMERDEIATVWLHADGRPSRVALDVAASGDGEAEATAVALLDEVAGGTGLVCEIVSASVTTDRERLRAFDGMTSAGGPGPD